MKKIFLIFSIIATTIAHAQDINVLLKAADNLEKQLKETEALDKYKQVVAADPNNTKAIIKAVELTCRIGARQPDKNAKKSYYESASSYADKALIADSNNADSYYAKALVAGKLTEVEEDKKKIVEHVRQINENAVKALALNATHPKANYILGKWHYEMLTLNWFKKAAIKTLYGGLPNADIDTAITYMEKCRTLEPYFVLNYLDLAKAYKYKSRPSQAIEVLNKLVRLPTRTADDADLKAEGKKLLDEMQ